MPDENKSLALPPANDASPSRVERVSYYQVPVEEAETH